MTDTPKKISINLNFKQKYGDMKSLSSANSSFQNTPRDSIANLSKEEQIRIILKRNSNERTAQNIILLSQQIENVNFLKQFIGTKSPEFLEMCKFLEVEEYNEDHILFQQGDIGEKFFIILEGQVSVIINVTNKKGVIEQKEVGKLKQGASFGDLALLFNSIRNATIKLDKKSTFIVLRKEIFQKYIKYKTPPNAHEILKFYDQYILTPYALDLPEKIQILSKTEQTNYISNSLIIRQGQSIQNLYFIKKGVVKVNRLIKFRINPISKQLLPLDYSDPTPLEIANKEYKEISLEIDEIYEGSQFADYELFKQLKSTVSIVAYTPCEIVQMSREDMVVLPPKMTADMQGQIKPYPDDYKLRQIYLEGLQWMKYKNFIVDGVCKENILRKSLQNSVNFFSRSKLVQIPLQPNLVCFDDSFTKDSGDTNQMENKFFGQYNTQMSKRKSILSSTNYNNNSNKQSKNNTILSVQIKKPMNSKKDHHNKQNISINPIKPELENEDQLHKINNKGKDDFLDKTQRNSFYIQDDNDFLKFDEELKGINSDNDNNNDGQLSKEHIQQQLMRQLDPFNRNSLSQKKFNITHFNQKKQNGKSLTINFNKTNENNNSNNNNNNNSSNSQRNFLSPKLGKQSQKLQFLSQNVFSSHKLPQKSQKQILPKITQQIKYIANTEDIICQITQKQHQQYKQFQLELSMM